MTSFIFPDLNDVNLFKNVEDIFNKILTCGVNVCGFDTETTVSDAFSYEEKTNQKEETKYVSIIQICIEQNHGGVILEDLQAENDMSVYTCYIIPIKKLFLKYKIFPPSLLKFFKTKNIIKVGADIHLDIKKLEKYFLADSNLFFFSDEKEQNKLEFTPMKKEIFKGFIDLQDLARSMGNKSFSLNDLAKAYLNIKKMKSKLGNYEEELSDKQIYYACHDSYLSLAIYNKMINKPLYDINKEKFYCNEDEKINNLLKKSKDIPQGTHDDESSFLYPNEKKDELVLLSFFNKMKIFITNDMVKYDALLNSVRNSYAPWIKYDIKKLRNY